MEVRRPRFNIRSRAGDPEKDEKPIRLIDVHPIRLIDVHSTIAGSSKGNICFKAADGWDFHVISHTWSLEVRDLSEKIGKRIGGVQQMQVSAKELGQLDAYNEAFKEADFSREPCYKLLIEFLQLLVPEGVKEIWFDALCINQIDHVEKSREISNMGAYYSRSRGCYVIQHGLGHGYQLWEKEAGVLPRWFTRVWTFQEFILPERLSFIVEGLDGTLIKFINGEIKKKSKNGLCRGCFKERFGDEEDELWGSASNLVWWQFKESWDNLNIRPKDDQQKHAAAAGRSQDGRDDHGMQIISEDGDPEILSSNTPCVKCHSLPMIRKVAHLAVAGNNHASTSGAASQGAYFVDREAYLGVMQFKISFPGKYSMKKEEASLYRQGVATLSSLYKTLSRKTLLLNPAGRWNLHDTLVEVRKRACSVEEDRVLSILELLGVQLSQLRTGKGLQKQLVELAKVCSEEILVGLCRMDAKPCCTEGMSWAPHFEANNSVGDHAGPWHVLNMQSGCEVEVEVEKQHVSEAGSIKLCAKVVSGVVLPVTALPNAMKEATKFRDSFLEGLRPRRGATQDWHAEHTEQYEWDMKMGIFQKASRRGCLIGGFGGNLSHHVCIHST